MNEPGLLGFIRALRMHQEDFTEMFLAALIQYGADNPIELLAEHLRRWSENDLEYLSILLIVKVANELATLRCVSLSVSVSQEKKQRGTVSRYCRVPFHSTVVTTGSDSQ